MAIAVRASERQVMGIANIGIVYTKMIGDTIVSQLYECSQFIRYLARVKKTSLVWEKYFAIFSKCTRQRAVRKGGASVGIRDLHHHADGGNGIQRKGLMRISIDSRYLFNVVEHVAV